MNRHAEVQTTRIRPVIVDRPFILGIRRAIQRWYLQNQKSGGLFLSVPD